MPQEIRLPIKVVTTRDTDYQKPKAGGSHRMIFGDVPPELRRSFVDQIGSVQDYFQASFQQIPDVPAVARVILKDKALAKSHRPSDLFNRHTCPIIGIRNFGELLISVRPQGLRLLAEKIAENTSQVNTANISTIERIEPYTAEEALRSLGQEDLEQFFAGQRKTLKFKLFRHHDPTMDGKLLDVFMSMVASLRLPRPEQIQYGPGMRIYRLQDISAEKAPELARFVGTQSLSIFPSFRLVRTQSTPLRAAQVDDFPGPDTNTDYPVVGVIDTGANPNDPLLAQWCVGREEYVIPEERDHNHGSFVAGLIVNARALNRQDPRFPVVQSKFLDVVAVPGPKGYVTEDQLIAILEEVVPKYPTIKIWNLSLALNDPPCSNDAFSDFGIALDTLQDRFGVRFIMAAGNYIRPPLRSWPPEDLGEADRIRPPADSVRGITVGSLAHLDRPTSRVKREEPSPFSRRGPGAAHLPKPDISHYGGNCTAQGDYQQIGVLSIDSQKNLAEDVGTSFSTPIVSSLIANIMLGLNSPSPALAKALLIHSAVLTSTGLDANEMRYRGFGTPGDISSILTCTPWMASLIFEPDITPGMQFFKNDFPIPDCLRTADGKVRADLVITLVYDPPLDPTFGVEYCRRNIEVSLGTYDLDADGKPRHHKRVPEEPRDIGRMYEKYLIEHGFKWSPVKIYRESIKRGIAGQNWRLLVESYDRSGFYDPRPTLAAIIVTIMDPDRDKPVYDQVITRMAISGWITQDIQIAARVRSRFNL